MRFSRIPPLTNLILVCLIALGLISCEKEVNINPGGNQQKVVVDGFIETGLPPVVVLTNSFSFFSKIDLSTLENAFIHNADVRVSDGIQEVKLREYALDTGFNTSKYYFYSVDTADLSSLSFIGQVNRFYNLSILVNGKRYDAQTKIPAVMPVDSMWAIPPTVLPTDLPTAMLLYIRYSDPDTPNNTIRYFTSTNGGLYFPGFNSVYEDAVINGTSFNINLAPGIRDRSSLVDSNFYFFRGDTVRLKWASIDRGVYDFWSTFEFSAATAGNPFGSPVSVTSNIRGGALGLWAGYGTSYSTLVIPK